MVPDAPNKGTWDAGYTAQPLIAKKPGRNPRLFLFTYK